MPGYLFQSALCVKHIMSGQGAALRTDNSIPLNVQPLIRPFPAPAGILVSGDQSGGAERPRGPYRSVAAAMIAMATPPAAAQKLNAAR